MGYSNNRRFDHAVRHAINAVQELLFDPQAAEKIFPMVLKDLASITDSDYSAIFTADQPGAPPIEPNSNAQLRCIQSPKNGDFIAVDTLSHWFDRKFMPLRPVYFNRPLPRSHASLLTHPENVSALMILPIVVRFRYRGVCLLARRNGRYDAS